MPGTTELPEDLREQAASMFKGVSEEAQAHSRLRLENATFLIRRLLPTATGIGVNVLGWYCRDGGVDLTEIRDYAGRLLWQQDDSAPRESVGVDQADYRLRWQRLLTEIIGELDAALDFSTPSSCGWEEVEVNHTGAMPYWIELPGGPTRMPHKVAT